jgi:lysophospholipase L1-like esterase
MYWQSRTNRNAEKNRAVRIRALIPAVLLAFAGCAQAQTHWVGSWAASQQRPEPSNTLAEADLRDAALRQVVHLSIGGPQLRVHLSNRFGTAPLHFTSVHIAQPADPASGKISAATDKALTFSGRDDVTIPAGADYISDPAAFPVAPLSDLAITLHIDNPPIAQTGHPGSRATSWIAHGDFVSAAELSGAKKVEHWYFISAVDVAAPAKTEAVAALGDSITDGHGATTDGNNRWPDVLARRLQSAQATQALSVLNLGTGGNRLLLDGLGPNALARLDSDALAQAGVRYLIVLEGVNDIGSLARTGEVPPAAHGTLVRGVIGAYEQIVTRAHTHGIQVIGATILPFVGSEYYHRGPAGEADRQAVNQWIRTPGHFDAFIDFDKVTGDPEHPDRLLQAFDSGDHLHPSPAGYAAMAEAIPLSLFTPEIQSAAPAPRIAFTFDDLPAHSALPVGETRFDIATKIIAALRDAHMPPIYGFVNGLGVEKQPADVAVLREWRAAGYPLGNHSWSHMNANQNSLEGFEADITRNEPLLSGLMKNEDWHWFRFPYLAEGDTPEKKAAIRAFLLQHGYRVAGVTMSFGDYQWNEPYARCKAKGDSNAIASLESSYLQAAEDSIGYYRQLSQTLYGRDIPYVLLMHIGAFDAEMLPKLLDLYRAKGFQFVTLDEAERDDFYREDTDLRLPPGPDMLEGVAAERHAPIPHHYPAPALDSVCR